MMLPELVLTRADGRCLLTVCAVVSPGADPRRCRERLAARVASLREAPLPPLDPHPGPRRASSRPGRPRTTRRSVAAAVERIRAGEIEKLVLAREVRVEAPSAHSPAALFGALRELFESCFCFCVGTPEAAFIGASPELLVRRSGAGAATVALAGSARRSADPAVDDHLGEQLLHSAKDRDEHAIVAGGSRAARAVVGLGRAVRRSRW